MCSQLGSMRFVRFVFPRSRSVTDIFSCQSTNFSARAKNFDQSTLTFSLSIHIFFFSPSHNNIIHVFTCKCRDSLRFAWIFAYEREIFIPFTNTQYQKCDLFTFIFDSPLIKEQAIPVFVCMFFFLVFSAGILVFLLRGWWPCVNKSWHIIRKKWRENKNICEITIDFDVHILLKRCCQKPNSKDLLLYSIYLYGIC